MQQSGQTPEYLFVTDLFSRRRYGFDKVLSWHVVTFIFICERRDCFESLLHIVDRITVRRFVVDKQLNKLAESHLILQYSVVIKFFVTEVRQEILDLTTNQTLPPPPTRSRRLPRTLKDSIRRPSSNQVVPLYLCSC
jgi:hypothetical protein